MSLNLLWSSGSSPAHPSGFRGTPRGDHLSTRSRLLPGATFLGTTGFRYTFSVSTMTDGYARAVGPPVFSLAPVPLTVSRVMLRNHVVYVHVVTCLWTCAEPPTASPCRGPVYPVRMMDRQSANSCVWVVRWCTRLIDRNRHWIVSLVLFLNWSHKLHLAICSTFFHWTFVSGFVKRPLVSVITFRVQRSEDNLPSSFFTVLSTCEELRHSKHSEEFEGFLFSLWEHADTKKETHHDLWDVRLYLFSKFQWLEPGSNSAKILRSLGRHVHISHLNTVMVSHTWYWEWFDVWIVALQPTMIHKPFVHSRQHERRTRVHTHIVSTIYCQTNLPRHWIEPQEKENRRSSSFLTHLWQPNSLWRALHFNGGPSVCIVKPCRKAVSTEDVHTSTASALAAVQRQSLRLLREYHSISCIRCQLSTIPKVEQHPDRDWRDILQLWPSLMRHGKIVVSPPQLGETDLECWPELRYNFQGGQADHTYLQCTGALFCHTSMLVVDGGKPAADHWFWSVLSVDDLSLTPMRPDQTRLCGPWETFWWHPIPSLLTILRIHQAPPSCIFVIFLATWNWTSPFTTESALVEVVVRTMWTAFVFDGSDNFSMFLVSLRCWRNGFALFSAVTTTQRHQPLIEVLRERSLEQLSNDLAFCQVGHWNQQPRCISETASSRQQVVSMK